MTKKILISICLILSGFSISNAQSCPGVNLIQNGNFEAGQIPDYTGQITRATGWDIGLRQTICVPGRPDNTPDLFDTRRTPSTFTGCGFEGGPNVGIPNNFTGTGLAHNTAMTGIRYAGLCPGEYMTASLVSTPQLRASVYTLEFWARPASCQGSTPPSVCIQVLNSSGTVMLPSSIDVPLSLNQVWQKYTVCIDMTWIPNPGSARRLAFQYNSNATNSHFLFDDFRMVSPATITPSTPAVCSGQCVTLTANVCENGGCVTGPYSYTWNTQSTNQSVTVCPTSHTIYTVTVTDAWGNTSTATNRVIVNQKPIADAGPESLIQCIYSNMYIGTAPAAPGNTYTWTSNNQSTISQELSCTNCPQPLISNNSYSNRPFNRIYKVTVTNSAGCTATDEISITYIDNSASMVVNPGTSQTVNCGTPVTLGPTACPGGTYTWYPATALSNPTICNPVATPNSTTVYILYLIPSGETCQISNKVTITVVGSCNATPGKFNEDNSNNMESFKSFSLFPNPSNGQMQLDYSQSKGQASEFIIVDILGKKVAGYKLTEGENTLHINESQLKQGIYFYHVIVNGVLVKTDKISIIK